MKGDARDEVRTTCVSRWDQVNSTRAPYPIRSRGWYRLHEAGAATSFALLNSGNTLKTSSAYFTFPNGADTCTP
jgi:hypothetical protein